MKNTNGITTISNLNIDVIPSVSAAHQKRINITLQKMSSGIKNKSIRKLMEQGVLSIGFNGLNLQDSAIPVYTVEVHDGNKLRLISANLNQVVDPNDFTQIIRNIQIIQSQQEIILRNERILTQTSQLEIDMAKETIEKYYLDMIQKIDYFKLADLYYYGYVKFLAAIALKSNKQKIFGAVNEILQNYIFNVVDNNTQKELDSGDKKLLSAIIDYIMVVSYSDQDPQSIIKALKAVHKDEEVIERFVALKPYKYNKFNDIVYLLAEANLINLTPNVFNKFLTNYFGANFIDFNGEFKNLVGYLVSLLHTSEIFKNKLQPGTKESILRLEQLVLNYKSSILFKKY